VIAVFEIKDHHRSRLTCRSMLKGIKSCGEPAIWGLEQYWKGEIYDTVVFYGLEGNTPKIFADHINAGKNAIYIDLGWWGRREGGRWTGYHKLVRNSRHPNVYFQSTSHSPGRFERFGIGISPWRRGGSHILLAGMGDKGAIAEGFRPTEWERAAIVEIRKHTDRPIVYRPKPSWKDAAPLPGAGWSPRTQELEEILSGAWAVVTHHSNVAVDGIVRGIPAFCWGGVGQRFASQSLSEIENPYKPPSGREQWCADIAWCQWSIAEMASGDAWRYLRSEGLV
jgi:hypothetical protein